MTTPEGRESSPIFSEDQLHELFEAFVWARSTLSEEERNKVDKVTAIQEQKSQELGRVLTPKEYRKIESQFEGIDEIFAKMEHTALKSIMDKFANDDLKKTL